MGNGTPIGRVRGLGAAHDGTHHWVLQRFTAIGNLILILFLAFSFALLPGYDYATMHEWVVRPITATALALISVNTFWHARHGLQILVEDYVHTPGNKFAVTAILNILAVGGSAFALLSIAGLAFGGAV